MSIVIAIAAMICTALATLVMIVFNLAGAANASAAQIHSMKLWAGGMTLLAVVGVVAGIFLLRAGHPGWASLAAFAPTLIFGIILLIALLKS
jgi:hypothetical protein